MSFKQGRRGIARWVAVAALAAGTMMMTAADARAETITATLRFMDGDGTPQPITNARVEIWRIPVFCCWHQVSGPIEGAFRTDGNGQLNVVVPFGGAGMTYALRVFATNPAAQVFTQDLYVQPFYREPGLPGPQITRVGNAPSDVLNWVFTFNDAWATNHFNVADAIQRGKAYADARRDPLETDVIPRLTVLMNSIGSTFYDPISHAVRLGTDFAADDFTILHEYAHFLEEQISSFLGLPAIHDGCTVFYDGPGYAWMEGFASYFAQAVARDPILGARIIGPGLGTFSAGTLESPSCPPSTAPNSSRELFVAAALFDLTDSANESTDELCTLPSGNLDRVIFQIFDREMDNMGLANPTLDRFHAAWIARGLDLPPLQATFGASNVSFAAPATLFNYDSFAAANIAIWRPGAASQWHIIGGGGGVVSWGTAGDRPVPADYDGDGFTDVAVWRPWEGNWYVQKSASRVSHVTQWGTLGDIPLPGDYDGDGETDYAVYRPGNGNVFIHNDGCGDHRVIFVGFGTPVVADTDGDNRDEPGIFDGSTGTFTFRREGVTVSMRVGTGGGGTPLIGDFDFSGSDDVAIYRPATGMWDIRRASGVVTSQWWGDPGDQPVAADFDGDGYTDLATFHPTTGVWWILEQDGPQWSQLWGTSGDVPVAAP